jgi:hypothetical protein
VLVPANPAVGTTADFCAAKYEMKDNSGATSEPAGTPWSRSLNAAKTECANIGGHLITNPEWMTLARNIESTAVNWSSGTVGTGSLNTGHSDDGPFFRQEASTDDNPCVNTNNVCSPTVWHSQRRTHVLSNGEVIWDVAGNVAEFVDWTITQAQKAGSSSCNEITFDCEWNSVDTNIAPGSVMEPITWQAADPSLTSVHGIGKYRAGDADPAGALRGGYWDDSDGMSPGIYNLSLNDGVTTALFVSGFRCVFAL